MGIENIPSYGGTDVVPDTLPDSTAAESELYQNPQNIAETALRLMDPFRQGRVIVLHGVILRVNEEAHTLRVGILDDVAMLEPITVPWDNWTFTQDDRFSSARFLADSRGGRISFDDYLV